jgi:capsular exopolysaccharide synthesis family protein
VIKKLKEHIFFSGALFMVCSASIFGLFQLQSNLYEAKTTFFISGSKGQMVNTDLNISKLLTRSYGLGLGSSLANELAVINSRRMGELLADTLFQIKENDPERWTLPVLHQFQDTLMPLTTSDTVAMRIRFGLQTEHDQMNSELVTVRYQSLSPREAKLISDLTVIKFNALSTENKNRTAQEANQFLVKQEARLLKLITNLEDSLQHFQENQRILYPDLQFPQWFEQKYKIEDELIDNESKRRQVNASLAKLEKQEAQLTSLLQKDWDKSLRNRLETIQFQLAELKTEQIQRSIYNQPGKEFLKKAKTGEQEQIAFLQKSLEETLTPLLSDTTGLSFALLQQEGNLYSVNEMILSLEEKRQELEIQKIETISSIQKMEEQLTEINGQIKDLPPKITQLSKLKREIQIANNLYGNVTKQLAEVHFWNSSQSNKGRILDPSIRPKEPVSPNPLIWFFGGFLISAAISIAITYLKIRFDNKITGKEQLLEMDIPLLGVIPDFSELSNPINDPVFKNGHHLSAQLAQFLSDDAMLLDSLNRLRMRVFHNHLDEERKIILVTSSNKGEGKSTLSCNLATTLEHFGKRVLLIDLDLHRPTLHKIFDVPRKPGVSDLISDQAEIADCICSTPLENLYTLPAGKMMIDPVKLIESDALNDLLNYLSKSFDHVIIDTPPYGLVADSAHLIQKMDSIIIAVRHNVTNIHELEITLEGLSLINARVTGIVLTAAPISELSYIKRSFKDYFYSKKSVKKEYEYS